MLYEFESYFNRPSYYSRPRYYSSYYTPSYYDTSYRYYRYPSSYTASIYRPYRYNYNYRYDIPDYRYRTYITTSPRVFPSVWSEADRYAFTHGLNFNAAAQDIRSSASKILQDIRYNTPRAVSVPRITRASSLDPYYSDGDYDDTIFRARRGNIRFQHNG